MTATEQAFPSTAIEVGGGRVITTPFQFVADADTFLRVVSNCSVAGVTLAIQGRRLDEFGRLQPIIETHAPSSNRTTLTQNYLLGAGAVLNLTVFATAGSLLSGQCYVQVQLLRNTGSTAIVLGTLLGGYVTTVQALGFPGSPIVSSLEGEPAIREITGTNPAPGAAALEACPFGARWELLGCFIHFTTAAVGADRRLSITFGNGAVFYAAFSAATPQPLGTSVVYTFGPNVPTFSAATSALIQLGILGRNILRANGVFIVSADALNAGDDFEAPMYQVREWLEVNN